MVNILHIKLQLKKYHTVNRLRSFLSSGHLGHLGHLVHLVHLGHLSQHFNICHKLTDT